MTAGASSARVGWRMLRAHLESDVKTGLCRLRQVIEG